jgi:hypothetical protein
MTRPLYDPRAARNQSYNRLRDQMRAERPERNMPNPLVIAPLLATIAILLGYLWG